MGVSYSGEAVYKDGRPIHTTERMTEFDGKKIKTTEVVDGEKRERIYPARTTTGQQIGESDIFQMLGENNHMHHSVLERLMETFVRTHPELSDKKRSPKTAKSTKRITRKYNNKTQKNKRR